MITKSNFKEMILDIGFYALSDTRFEKKYPKFDYIIQIDFTMEQIIYQEGTNGITVNDRTTCNFNHPENFVVLECVNRILEKGYRPEHIELERKWTLGHEQKSGKADICVLDKDGKSMLFIVECKTYGKEYTKEYNNTINDGGQLFSYWQQERAASWLILYASDFLENVVYKINSIHCFDDKNILELSKKDHSILVYQNAHTAKELFDVWNETYEKRFCGDVVFRDDSQAYHIGIKPLRKRDLGDFTEDDKIVNKFEEILRHNNVSDKENAFNRLIALFICKLVDEIQKSDNDIVDFQYKVGTDTYESLQDRLQSLHAEGMKKFMREEIIYVSDDYAEKLVQNYTGQKRKNMIAELKQTIRILKFYTNNDFSFKDVHNEDLFYQNGKILVEVVQLFEKFRIIGSNDLQMLGDLFEQLLNKGFKQNEGQFFTPIPITHFIWDSIPLHKIVKQDDNFEYPKIVDYACGAGHFLTEGFKAINDCVLTCKFKTDTDSLWVKEKIYGIEKDYRLARVSKISLFMHGAGDGNIIFGDGLENYPDKNIIKESFDILVANPPYSVAAFKPHLNIKNNDFKILNKISNNGSEIETLFVERTAQLLKPCGIACVILPSSILNKDNESFIASREILLQSFNIRAIVQLGAKTFGETGTNTVVLFLEKFDEPPKRIEAVEDSITAIFDNADLSGWEDEIILKEYLLKIDVTLRTYKDFVTQARVYTDWEHDAYFGKYLLAFLLSTEITNKQKQKSFKKLSSAEQNQWYNQHFFDFVRKKEIEKIRYFALVYHQTTLIVTAPDDNKEQEQFLGYKWSGRKGQEGIREILPGGKLYNPNDRTDENTIAGIIRNMFYGKTMTVHQLKNYYYYLRTQDMLDFSNVTFNISIKTVKTRVLKNTIDLKTYQLSDKKCFDISIGNRVLSTEIEPNGEIPIFSANVFQEFGRINKQNLTDFSIPSILWGIDGDWMVNYMPANQPFYPTDHCGVLRIKTNDILPQYMTFALQVEGEYEQFSRSNRASIQKIESLTFQVPKLSVQQQIVDEIIGLDEKIKVESERIKKYNEDIKLKFMEQFGNPKMNIKGLPILKIGDFATVKGGKRLPKGDTYADSITSHPYVRVIDMVNHSVNIQTLVYITQATYEKIARYTISSKDVYISIAGTIGQVGAIPDSIDGANLTENAAKIVLEKDAPIDRDYLIWYLSLPAGVEQIEEKTIHTTQPKLALYRIEEINVLIPSIDAQREFAAFVRQSDKLKVEAQEHKKKLIAEKFGGIAKK